MATPTWRRSSKRCGPEPDATARTDEGVNVTQRDRWPRLVVDEWTDTRDTLHLYMQVVGKVRLANEPLWHHWWNTPLYLTTSGLTSALIPHATGPSFQIDFDFLRHAVIATTVEGTKRSLDLTEAPPVAEFHAQLLANLDDLGVGTEIWPMPVEIPDAIRFDEDYEHASYDPEAVWRFWQSLVAMEPVFKRFRSHFVGKSSPVHLFWGALDLASTRFSGRDAPPHPGGAPNCGPHVMWEAYSQEVSSAGYWPGPPGKEGIFYSYAYPDPQGFRDHPVRPDAARWDDQLSEFVLPYEAVRTAPDPEATLLEFLQTTYEAAAITASWDRASLERNPDAPVTDAARIVDGTVASDAAAASTPGIVAGPEAGRER